MSLGTHLVRLFRDPLAWLGAVAVAAVGAEQPGDWIAHAVVRAARPSLLPLAPLDAPTFLDFVAANEEAGLRWLLLATLGWGLRLPLVAASIVAARPSSASSASFFSSNVSRALRTRVTGILVTSAFGAVPAFVLFAWRKHSASPLLPDVALALLVALAGGWLALADRYAFASFDGRQDQIRREAIDAAHNAPHYLDTGVERGGYSVADGTDSAVTSAGWALLTRGALVVVAVGVVVGLVRAVAVASTASVPWGPRILAGAFGEVFLAVLWTRHLGRYGGLDFSSSANTSGSARHASRRS